MWVTRRGAVRTASEFGRAFPQAKVIQSSGQLQITSLPEGRSLVIATLGSEPVGMYAGIFVLDAQLAYSQVQLRSQEEVRSHWFKLLAQLEPDGAFYLSLPSTETISQGLIRADSYDLASREMHERHDAKLPPYYKLMICEGPYSDLSKISELLEARSFISFPLPETKDGKGRLLVKYEVAKGEEIAEFFASLQRVRAAQKREILTLRFDPYSIA
jgi:primosomal protein N' (replication factor Y)